MRIVPTIRPIDILPLTLIAVLIVTGLPVRVQPAAGQTGLTRPAAGQSAPARSTAGPSAPARSAAGPSAPARPAAEPFSTIDVRLSGATEMSSSSQLKHWSSDYAGALLLSTPFYSGRLQTGMSIQPFEARSSAQPDFWTGFLFLGWAQRWTISDRLHAEAAARVGNFFMTFDEDDVAGIRNESELATAAAVSIHVRPYERIGLFVESSYTRVYTFVRMNFIHVSAGITYRFQAPEWLQGVIR